MGDQKYIAASVTTGGTLLKKGFGTVVAIYVTKAGGSGSKLEIFNTADGSGTAEFTVYGESVQSLPKIMHRCRTAVYAKVTTGGNYVIVYG